MSKLLLRSAAVTIATAGLLISAGPALAGPTPACEESPGLECGTGSNTTDADGTAVGIGANASGSDGATAVGQNAQATSVQTTALGEDATASGGGALALGNRSMATGPLSIAIGNEFVTAIGPQASGFGSIAIGNSANSVSNGSIAVGVGATSIASESTALGTGSRTTGTGSVALGSGSIADADFTVSVGNSSVQRRIVNLAAGTANTDAVNVAQLTNEANARTAADVVLGQRIDTLSGRVGLLESSAGVFSLALADTNFRLEQLDQRISGGVAAAAALGSAIAMPGKSFTFTANVANYNGEQGFAAGLTGRVSDNFAVGAGIAGNTGDGEIITQAGFAFGW